jgi:NADH dehydrogenase
MKTILVAGSGFAGLWAALGAARQADLSGADVRIRLVSPAPTLTIRPRLYQRNPQALAVDLQRTLTPVGVEHVPMCVQEIDLSARSVSGTIREGGRGQGDREQLRYDRLVLAMGSQVNQPSISGIESHTQGVDDLQQAIAFDQALGRLSGDTPASIAILGAGFTGIELALEMRDRLTEHAGESHAQAARIVLLDSQGLGGALGEEAQPVIRSALNDARIEIEENVQISDVSAAGVTLADGRMLECTLVVNALGLRAHPITQTLKVPLDESGRIVVDENLKAAPGLFAAGDIAHAMADDDHAALMSCQHAMPMGKCAGANAVLDLIDESLLAYRQPDYVTCLDLGRAGALLTQGWDRNLVMNGPQAKELKNQINNQWIYPPADDAAAILAAAAMDWHPSQAANG